MKRMLVTLAAMVGAMFVAAPASAVEPQPEERVFSTHITDRPDSGNHGDWALDTFDRDITITGGPNYVILLPKGDDKELDSETRAQVQAEFKIPEIDLCDLVKKFRLTWKYRMTVVDEGTFVTLAGPALSPENGDPLVAGINGKMYGGAIMEFYAPAHWCTYEPLGNSEGPNDISTGEWPALLFGEKYVHWGEELFVAWGWIYWTCADQQNAALEKWKNSSEGNAGDIVGLTCPTPSPTPTPTPSTGDQLPKTGTKVTTIAMMGGGMIVLGFGAVLIGRRKRAEVSG